MTPKDSDAHALLERIALCTEVGKDRREAPYPPEMVGQDGVDELTERALAAGVDPNDVLTRGLMVGMERLGAKFAERSVFVPHLLLSAQAMARGMERLKPFFQSGEARRRGTLVLGVVQGDLHDIGKRLVRMMVVGAGWEVIDLGTDTPAESFVEAVEANPGCVVGLGALLTTTMEHMGRTVEAIKARSPGTLVVVGGAPVNSAFAQDIGADRYLPDAQAAREYLSGLVVDEP